eukprot:CAMPEP_0194266894 /NCGR_PEP_ID=MMETSP0169-20130528/1636_1 /TAXON_ID=218684 /ORGANISM="Corethron pennatum, Strain L29A3" /LENGTH=474 /DNA_ID=CAMNT_0039007669 /DNA_START=158 /DNA_END=1582 /DNA_ORIENTATION=+
MNYTVVLTCVVLLTAVSTAMAKYLALPAGSFGSRRPHGLYYTTVTTPTSYHRSLQFDSLIQDIPTYDIGPADCWYQMAQNGFDAPMDALDDKFVCEQLFTPSASTIQAEMKQGNCTDMEAPPPDFCRDWNHTKCCHDAIAPERTLSDFLGYSDNIETCMSLCLNYTYFGRQGAGECWCGDELFFDHGAIDSGCDCNGTDVGDLIECIYSKVHRVSVDYSGRPDPNPRDEGIAQTAVAIHNYPEIDASGITRINFCMVTTLTDVAGHRMQLARTPFESEFHYDGNFAIEVEVGFNDATGTGAADRTLYTAEAFVCDPATFTETADPVEIGGVLYVCVTPKSTQRTTLIVDVINFRLSQDGDAAVFDAVDATVPSDVTVIAARGTRNLIIGTRLPAMFYVTGGDITGVGEVVLGQQDRRLDTGGGSGARGLQAGASDGFRLKITVNKFAGSSGVSGLHSRKMSTIFFLVGALYCVL